MRLFILILILPTVIAQEQQYCCQTAGAIVREYKRMHTRLWDEKSQTLDAQVTSVQNSLLEIDSHVSAIEGQITAVERHMTSVEERVEERSTSLETNLEEKVAALDLKVERLIELMSANVIANVTQQLSLVENRITQRTSILENKMSHVDFPNLIGNSEVSLKGHSPNRGQLEVLHNGTRHNVCPYNFTTTEAVVFCRSLGLPHENAEISDADETSNLEGLLSAIGQFISTFLQPRALRKVNCTGASDVWFCRHSGWDNIDVCSSVELYCH
ncbi:hypothetical protein CAPTEDRAFT_220759 [Capitella teleta]|uniref:SRCR domain-containing protein n=1 Tax=Capitella teleta TaxID=283909 RepID=R7U7E8_CAPTE|nr:hypothetical protein CAPTEDRAFT_220759 [Capitella teleta]|eukprot:ELU01889.1 hypothetical protein CAPTEDRAFT_220759 [Capitella teleta]